MNMHVMPSCPHRLFLAGLVAAFMSGCAANPAPDAESSNNGIIPDKIVTLGPTTSYPLEKLVYWGAYAAAAWLILDPLAPNWSIEEARFPGHHVHMNLTMKRYYAGGAGEARQVFHRRAKELMRAGGYAGYEVVEYAESLESSVLGSQRTAEGVVRFVKRAG